MTTWAIMDLRQVRAIPGTKVCHEHHAGPDGKKGFQRAEEVCHASYPGVDSLVPSSCLKGAQ